MSELLSPAGTKEAFYAAISNGCDAIYLGLDKFNARAYAANFTLDNLKELVDFAHLRNVKIFVTMNTILYDDELLEAYKTIDQLALINVDALIIQDLALLNYVTNHYKSLEAHISTQVGIDDLDGARLMKELGATRVVFARETPLKTLKNIKKSLNIEIESFIHGALCVSYSGNCLMSSLIGDRSGNRGRCAGCCRQVYSLLDLTNKKIIKSGYLLSMKDLNTSQNIEDLRFIDSLKIEGRMKEPNYVASVTRYYRNLLDKDIPDKDGLFKVFNRTYTKGYLNEASNKDITNIERPNNFGYEIGKVVKIDKNKIWIKLFKELNKGDQIRIESKNIYKEISIPILKMFDGNFKEVQSSTKTIIIYTNESIEINAKVYKTKDINFVKKANLSIGEFAYRKLPLDMVFKASTTDGILLKIEYENFKIFAKSQYFPEIAEKNGTSKEIINDQLSKLNDTPYYLNNLKIKMDEKLFIPLKEINYLRRKAIEDLAKARLNLKVIKNINKEIIPQKFSIYKNEISAFVTTIEQFNACKELGIEHIYFNNVVSRNNENYINSDEEILCGGLGAISHYRKTNKIVSDASLNVVNYETVALLSSLGVTRITLSNEISKESINNLIKNYKNKYQTEPNLELIVYGKIPLMHTKYCPLRRLDMCGMCKINKYALKDKFETFPLKFNNDCTVNILNSKTLNIIDELDGLEGALTFRLSFYNETKEEITKIFNVLKTKLAGNETKSFDPKKETRGHFLKNPL